MDDSEPNQADDPGSRESTETPDSPGNRAELEARNRRLLRRYIEDVLGDGKMEVVHEIFHEEIEMDTRDGRTIRGPEKTKEYLSAVRDRFADLETSVDILMATTTEAMAKFDVTAVHEDDYFGVDATNREVTFRVFSKARIEDGKMIEQGDLVNPLRMQPPSKRHGQFAVLDQIHEGVVVVDREDRVVEINPVAEKLLDVGDRDPLNAPIRDLFGDASLPAVGSSAEIPLGDGQRIVDVSASSLTDLQDERIGRILVFRDVTARVRRRQQLETLNRRNEQLDQFVSVVAHDLRNPLATAGARVQLARETGEEEHFDQIEKAHDRIESIVEELRSAAQAGVTLETTESIALAHLVQKAWKTARTEGVTLQTDVPPDARIDGDPDLLRHVFENLLRNAADHNDPPVTVTVGLLDSSGSCRGFYVEDDGRGIPSDERRDVLEHGYTTDEDGTGLGLAIVSEFVEAHGWEMTVAEGDDGGARFEIATRDRDQA